MLKRLTFKGKYLDGLKKAFKAGTLQFPGQIASLDDPKVFQNLVDTLYRKEWVVFSKNSFENQDYVLDYLGRYTHRVAISNHRILSVENGIVTFTVKNRKTNELEIVELKADEFIRRFLLHVLPSGFVKIRFFGFLAHCHKAKKLNAIFKALQIDSTYVPPEKKSTLELIHSILGKDINQCPFCKKGTFQKIRTIPKGEHAFESKIDSGLQENNNSS